MSALLVWTSATDARAQSSDPRPTILVMELRHSDDVRPDVAQTLTEFAVSTLGRRADCETLSGADIQNLLELEGEKQAVGCEDDTSCLSEVASAMGARFVLFGRVSTLGDLTVIHLNLMDAEQARPIARELLKAADVEALAESLPAAITRMVGGVFAEAERPEAPAATMSEASAPPEEASAADAPSAPEEPSGEDASGSEDPATTTGGELESAPPPSAAVPTDSPSPWPATATTSVAGATGFALSGAVAVAAMAGAVALVWVALPGYAGLLALVGLAGMVAGPLLAGAAALGAGLFFLDGLAATLVGGVTAASSLAGGLVGSIIGAGVGFVAVSAYISTVSIANPLGALVFFPLAASAGAAVGGAILGLAAGAGGAAAATWLAAPDAE